MEIKINNFRCFHQPAQVAIRPINLIVGENSAGKTSFLAATRFVFDLFQRDVRASFNKPPFLLGSYESIAHYRGGRFGRASNFSFEISGLVVRDRQIASSWPHDFSICVEFYNRRSQSAINSVKFCAGSYGFEVQLSGEGRFTVWTPSSGRTELTKEARFFSDDEAGLDLTFLQFWLRSLKYRFSREIGPPLFGQNQEELDVIERIYNSFIRQLPNDVYASAPVRTHPERTYNPADFSQVPDGAHIPFVLAELRQYDKDTWENIQDSLNKFGKSSGLFNSVDVKRIGNAANGPFQVVVDIENRKSNIIDVGYGVSQALPIITDILRAKRRTMFLFQQPEVHLHPRAQAELGTFFKDVALKNRHTLLIETHSDYLIDRIRMHVREGSLKPSDVSILYFERDRHDVQINLIEIDKEGNIIGAPPNYRSFFLHEEMRSLGIS